MSLISVIVATRNRSEKIEACLRSILANSFSDFELLVIDQSSDDKTEKIIKKIDSPQIKYLKMKKKGLSKARNLGIQRTSGEILTFTDDDCVVDKKWLENIYLSFQKDPELSAVFGKVIPYRSRSSRGLFCMSINKINKKKVLNAPKRHKRELFFGNNMSVKREIFEKIGSYKEWLGAGAVAMATEDEEIAYRILKNSGKILLSPLAFVYHDNWLPPRLFRQKETKYDCGFFAAFGYYAFKGDKTSKEYLTVFLREKLKQWKEEFIFCIRGFHPKVFLRFLWKTFFLEIYWYTRGTLIGFYYAVVEKS